MSNIYSKLQKARCEFQNKPIKKSGHNKFAGYHYFELGDMMPVINDLLDKHQLCSSISFYSDHATLTLTNAESPEELIVFSSPMANAQLKGCHDVQNLGATQTYLRRYLWVTAFEIVENDGIDATTGKDEEKPKAKKGNPYYAKENPKLEPLQKLVEVARARKCSDADILKALSIKSWAEFNRIADKEEHLKYATETISALIAGHAQ